MTVTHPARLKVDILGDSRDLGRAVDSADHKLGGLGSTSRKVGLAIGAGLAGAATAAVAFGVTTVKSASAAEQSFGAVESVFGKFATSVHRNATNAADAVGLSANAYSEMASIMGAQLGNMGVAQDQLAGKTDALIRTGADLSATFGGTVSDAVESLGSLMRGETDPIEKYGVSIKQADIDARLAADGLDGLEGKAAKAARTQALLGLVTDQTAAAHGKFAAESDTLAHKQQVLEARYDNLKVAIGNKLLPVVSDLFGWFDNKLVPVSQDLGRALDKHVGPAVRDVADFLEDDLVPGIKGAVRWFGDHLVPVLEDYVEPTLDGIGDAFHIISRWVHKNKDDLHEFADNAGKVADVLEDVLGPVLEHQIKYTWKALGVLIEASLESLILMVKAVNQLADALDTLSKIDPGKALGKLGDALNPFSGPELTTGPRLVTAPADDLTYRLPGLVTAALGTGLPGGLLSMAARGGTVVIDNRDQSARVRVDGALDTVSVADQLERILEDHRTRLGQAG